MIKFVQTKWVQLLILAAVTIAVYSNIFQNGLAWDDEDFLHNWPSIQQTGELSPLLNLPSLLAGEVPPGHGGIYRPIRSVIYLFNYQLWGANPTGYHIQGITTHIIIILLIYLIIELITKKRGLAFLTAILFATHPIHTEAVTYIAASMDTIGIAFFFLSFYFYLKSRQDKTRQKFAQFGSILYGGLAFLTYEITLTLPILIILYEICFKKLTFKNFTERFGTFKPYFFLWLAYVILRLLVFQVGNRADYLGETFSISARLSQIAMPIVYLKYLWLLIFPFYLTIAEQIPMNLVNLVLLPLVKVDSSTKLTQIFLKVDALFVVTILILPIFITRKIFKHQGIIPFSVGWSSLTLLTVSNLIPQGAPIAERFLYVPSFGFILLISYLIYQLFLYSKKIKPRYLTVVVMLIPVIITVLYSSATYLRNFDWRDSRSLWAAALRTTPNNAYVMGGMGYFYAKSGDLDTAIIWYKKAVVINPLDFKNRINLAVMYKQKGDSNQAMDELQQILSIQPNYHTAHFVLGDIYSEKNMYDKAVSEYKTAISIEPNNDTVHYNLGNAYLKQGSLDLALDEYYTTIKLNNNHAQAYNNIGIIYGQNQQPNLAIQALKTAILLNPQNAKTYFNLANVYEGTGEKYLAIEAYKEGLKISPNEEEIKQKLRKLLSV